MTHSKQYQSHICKSCKKLNKVYCSLKGYLLKNYSSVNSADFFFASFPMRYRPCYFLILDTYDEKFNKASQKEKNADSTAVTTALPHCTNSL